MKLVEDIALSVRSYNRLLHFNGLILRAIFFRATWRYLLSFQFMRSLYIQLHLPWTFEFRLPLKFGFRRPWTLPAFFIDFLEQIFTNNPLGAPPTWVFDTVVILNAAFVLFLAVLWVLQHISDLYVLKEAGEEFEFPIVQDQLENPGGSRSWMQEEFVALKEIAIWERPLNFLRLFYPGGKAKGSGVFKHDYIVIKLASCGESFTVEKEAKAGKYVKFTRGNVTQRGVTRRFSMELKGATVPVVELGHVLGKEGRGYHLLEGNCWIYAFNTTQSVIELCGKDPNLETEKRASLLKDLERLEKVKRTDPGKTIIFLVWFLLVLFIAVNMAIIGVTSKYKPWWLRWLGRLLQCDNPYWNPHSKLT